MQEKRLNIEARKTKIDFYKIAYIFFVCSFIGYVYEITIVAISVHQFASRGYMFVLKPLAEYIPSLAGVKAFTKVPLIIGLPFIEIYGFGGLIMVLAFRRLSEKPVKLFFVGMGIMTLFELLASYFCTEVLHQKYWDYSENILNFQGRICLESALVWGLLSLFVVKLLWPRLEKLYDKIEGTRFYKEVIIILVILTIACALCKYLIFPSVLAKQPI